MDCISHIVELRRRRKSAQGILGFVPTMGALHQGHLELVKQARQASDTVVVSIFVNPTQFNDPTDFEKYPRVLDQDARMLVEAGVDVLFAPSAAEMYGERFQSWLEPETFSDILEGASRPGHFRGVATVVTILLNAVQPDIAIFGEKDFQQLRIIEQLVADLKLPVSIERAATMREADGLAMSSRNARLSEEGRKVAPTLYAALEAVQRSFHAGVHDFASLEEHGKDIIAAQKNITLDYLRIVDEETLASPTDRSKALRVLLAALVDQVRLIDNLALS